MRPLELLEELHQRRRFRHEQRGLREGAKIQRASTQDLLQQSCRAHKPQHVIQPSVAQWHHRVRILTKFVAMGADGITNVLNTTSERGVSTAPTWRSSRFSTFATISCSLPWKAP